jgi:hypothetical protein
LNNDFDTGIHGLLCCGDSAGICVTISQVRYREALVHQMAYVGFLMLDASLLDHDQMGSFDRRSFAFAPRYCDVSGSDMFA